MTKEQLVKKWELAEGKMSITGIKDRYIKENMAQMLENQAKKDMHGNEIFTEASQGAINQGPNSLGMDGQDSWKFRPVALALVRRTFPDLFANKVVGVQAMSTPVGLAYALRVLYDDGGSVEAAWDQVDQYAGYSGIQNHGASGSLAGNNTQTSAANTGIYDTSATGATTSAGEGWTLDTTSGVVGADEWPQLKLKVDQTAITAMTRKLAASFSVEAAQDIRAMHGIDIEREMVNILQYEITAELDRELLMRMKTAATTVANGGAVITPVNCQTAALDGRWAGEKFMGIVANILHQANVIAVKTRRGPGNFVVVSPSIATALQGAGHPFVQYTSNVTATNTVLAPIGKLNGTLDVYRDAYARTDYALVGYKGPGISDVGIVFSPYIMGLTNRAVSPDDFSPRVGVMARYAITDSLLGSGRYYRLIPFINVNQLIATA
jgi:hypothetical protein